MQEIAKRTRRVSRRWMLGALALGLVITATTVPQAHKAITSKYNYNEHVFPILRERCGTCHVDGGAAPMSLLTYKDAVPWAESIREELLAAKMPPWYVDPFGPPMKGGHMLNALELDTLVTWAAGGTPEGDRTKTPPPVTAHLEWQLGKPDLIVQMAEEHAVGVGILDDAADVTISTGLSTDQWVKAADLMPGNSAMVRDATISIENGPVLTAWVPGYDVTPTPTGTAFRLPAGAKLRLQIHYKKPYLDEQTVVKDRSSIGLYYADSAASGHELKTLAIDGPQAETGSVSPRTFGGSVSGAAQLLAIRPSLDQPYASLDVAVVKADGGRESVLKLRGPRPEWRRRYWLAKPVDLPAGSKLEVTVVPPPPDPDEAPTPKRYPLQVGVDFVSQ